MRFIPFPLPISTADAKSVELQYAAGELELRFMDWQERQVQLRFSGVLRFSWDPLGGRDAPRGDEAYEVLESASLRELDTAGQLHGLAQPRHFKLCFNAESVLDVAAENVSAG